MPYHYREVRLRQNPATHYSRHHAEGNDQRDHPEEAERALGHGHRGRQGPGPHRQARQDKGAESSSNKPCAWIAFLSCSCKMWIQIVYCAAIG